MFKWKLNDILHALWIEFKFNWTNKMRHKLVQKVLKICSWKKKKLKNKIKIQIYVSLPRNGLNIFEF